MEEYEIDLRDLFFKIWKGKYIILGVFVLAVLLAALYSFVVLDPVYESRAVLRIQPLPREISTDLTWELKTPEGYTPLTEKVSVDIVTLSRQGYSSFLTHQRVLSNLQEIVKGELGREISSNRLINSLEREIQQEDNFIRLSFRDNDPQEAREILATWIKIFEREVFEQLLRENQRNMEQKDLELDTAYNRYSEISRTWTAFQREFSLDRIKKRVNELEREYIAHLSDLQETRIELSYFEETSKALERIVGQEEDNLEEIILDLGEKIQGQFFQNLKQLTLQLDEVNPVMVYLRQQRFDHQIQLEGLKNRAATLEDLLTDLDEEITVLREEISELEKEEKQLRDRYERAWKDLVRKEEEHNLLSLFLENLSHSGVTVFEEPTLRTGRVAPNHRLNIALAGILGIFLGTGGLLFFNFMRGEKREK